MLYPRLYQNQICNSKTGILACLSMDRQECLSYQLLYFDSSTFCELKRLINELKSQFNCNFHNELIDHKRISRKYDYYFLFSAVEGVLHLR